MLMVTTADEPLSVVPYLGSQNPRYPGVVKGTYRLVGKDCLSAYLVRAKKNYNDINAQMGFLFNRRKAVHLSPYEPLEHGFVLVSVHFRFILSYFYCPLK